MTLRRVPEAFSTGSDRTNAQKAWLNGFDTALRAAGSPLALEELTALGDELDRLADMLRDTRWQPFQIRDRINMGMRNIADKLRARLRAGRHA